MTSIRIFTALIVLLLVNDTEAQQVQQPKEEQLWVDSVFQSLTVEERIGQLFMVAAYSNQSASHRQSIEKLIKRYNIGGLLFLQASPVFGG